MSVAAAAYLKELLNNSSPVYSLDLFLQPSGILGWNYIQYSAAIWTFSWRKPVAVSICRINRTFLIYFQSKFSFPAPISKWFFLEKYTEKEIFRSIINRQIPIWRSGFRGVFSWVFASTLLCLAAFSLYTMCLSLILSYPINWEYVVLKCIPFLP